MTAAAEDHRAAALFCSLVSICLTLQFVAARAAIGAPRTWSAAVILGLSLLLLNGPVVWTHVKPARAWYQTSASITLFGLLALCVLGYLPGARFVGLGCAAAGVAALGWNLGRRLPVTIKGWSSLLVAAGLAVALAWLTGLMSWAYGYANPILEESLLVPIRSSGSSDTFFHAAMSSMIRTYGVPSTGLDGIPYTPYHFGSHLILGQLANLVGVNSLEMYQAGYALIFIPFVVQALLLLAASLRAARGINSRSVSVAALFVVLLGFARLVPQSAFDALGLWPEDIVISESFLFGIAIGSLVVAMMIPVFRELGAPARSRQVAALVALPLLVGLCGLCKISIALLLVALIWYFTLRLRLWRRDLILSVMATTILVFAIMRTGAAAERNEMRIESWYFLKQYVSRSWWPYVFVAHFFWSWVAGVLRIRQEGVSSLAELGRALRARRLLDVEGLVVLCVAGLVPSMLLPIAGGSGTYFIQMQWWLALSMIVAAVRPPAGWCAVSTWAVGATLIAVIAAWETPDYVRPLAASLHQLEADVRAPLSAHAHQSVFAALHQLAGLPTREKRRSLLHIPMSNQEYWTLGNHLIIPFVAPALTGMAMLDGNPPFADIDRAFRGFPSYRSHQSLSADPCRRALALGFYHLYVMEQLGPSQVTVRQTSCR